jgi:hypothetical protein
MREVRKEHEGVFNTLVNSVNFVAEFSDVLVKSQFFCNFLQARSLP